MMHELNNRIIEISFIERKRSNYEVLHPIEIIERIEARLAGNDDATNCLLSVCSRLARFGSTWGVRRGYSGQVQSISPLWIHSVGFNFTASKFIRTYRDSSHLWKGEGWHGEREGRRRKERSSRQTPYFVYRVLLSENL